MEVTVLRYGFGSKCTLGMLFVDGTFACYTLEDEVRTMKVYGKTCIPAGRYRLDLRLHGSFHIRYREKFGTTEGSSSSVFHKGMLEVKDVPGFTDILIHIGNDDDDTAGCLLVGMSTGMPLDNFIGNSTGSYKRIYPVLAETLNSGEDVYITYKNIEV